MVKASTIKTGLALASLLIIGGVGTVLADSPPAAAPAGSTIQQRIDQRKAERATVLSDTDKQRLVSTCVTAQGKVRSIENDAVPTLDNRTKVYGQIDAKLWVNIGQLKLANQDTFQLEKQRLGLADKTANFQTLATNYKQTLDDLVLINCQADPVGFKALLDTARLYYAQLHIQSVDSHDYVVNTVKASLAGFVSALQPKSPSNGGN